MDTLYTYYKAIREAIDLSNKDEQSSMDIYTIRDTDIDNDKLEQIIYEVKIDIDWIDTIEMNLDYIGNCIQEERQFILRTGDVLPIEKVKEVSRDSISHLSKHSNLIINKKGDEIVPNRLYSTAKLTDYAVYENRFIYFLLLYIKDFVDLRYKTIVRFSHLYESVFSVKKDITIDNRHIECNINFNEQIEDDPERRKVNRNEETLLRIQDIYRAVISYLNTPLMIDVSKAPLIKQPIVVTNTLKMNQNFKEALALYNYLSSYKESGFTIIPRKKVLEPFSRDLGYANALMIDMCSNLSYLFANDLIKEHRILYEKERSDNHKLILDKTKKELEHLKERLENNDISIEEYAVRLEKEQKTLKDEITDLKKEVKQKESLEDEISRLYANIEYLNEKLDDTINSISLRKQRYLNEIDDLKETNVVELEKVNQQHLKDINQIHELNKKENEEKFKQLDSLIKENEELKKKIAAQEENNALLKARLTTYRYEDNDVNLKDEFIDENKYKELEQEYKLLRKFMKKQWKFTKKKIIKDVKEEYKFKKDNTNEEK